ncbi:MAG: hypothetical protein JWR85_4178 [Marmoricola sp.]|nr:hypothetical protein [Marmoricola sp.]
MSLHEQFATNPEKETNGVPVTFAPNKDKTVPTFYVSRLGKSNKAYAKEMEKRTRPYRRQIELKTIDPEVAESIFMDVFIATIMRGWDNVELPILDAEGKPTKETEKVPFTEGNAKRLFTELPDLYDDLQEQARDAGNFRDEVLEAEAKN